MIMISYTTFVINSESPSCASPVDMPNPTGDDRKLRPQTDSGILKEDGRT